MKESSQARFYGRGIFTTIAINNGTPFLWEKHWRRLEHDAGRLSMDLSSYSEYMMLRGLEESIPDDRRALPQKARITFSDERPAPLWSDETPPFATSVSIVVAPRTEVPRPFKCSVSPYTINSRSALVGVKSCNYLENILAVEDAKRGGFHEAIRLNERGRVAGACMANVFWLKGGKLLTPALSTGCLPGTTREFVLENLDCEEVEATLDEIEDADAIFLTSAGLGVVAVDAFNGRVLMPTDHRILELISERT